MDGLRSRITICGCDDVVGLVAAQPFDAVISIEHPGAKWGTGAAPRLADLGFTVPQHILTFWDNDIDELPDMFTPALAEQSLALLRQLRGQRVLIHCRAGKARSAGVALLGIADELGAGRETDAVAELVAIRPIAMPNPLVVRVSDDVLERGGALIAAVDADAGIQNRKPAWVEAKLAGILRHGHHDPEKAMDLLAALGPERAAAVLARVRREAANPI